MSSSSLDAGSVQARSADGWVGRWLGAVVFGLLAVAMAAQIHAHRDPSTGLHGPVRELAKALPKLDAYWSWASLALLVGLASWMVLRRFEWARKLWRRRWVDVVLVVAVLCTGWMFFSAELARSKTVLRRWDGFIYGLGTKYYPEVGYFDLHPCALNAYSKRQVPDRAKVRDLRTYRMVEAGLLRKQGADCRERFTEQRWAEFERDLQLFAKAPVGYATMPRKVLRDAGMNGPPLQVFVASKLSRWFWRDYPSAAWLTFVDVLAMCAAFGVAARLLGWRVSALLAIAMFTCCVDRFFVTGGSLCRYLWLACLVVGFAGLVTKRWRLAGVFLVLAGGFGAFPAIFAVAAAVPMAASCVRERRLTTVAREYGLGVVITAVVALVLPALHGAGLGNYTEFLADMDIHGGPRPSASGEPRYGFAGYGVGLKWVWAYRGVHFSGRMNQGQLSREYVDVKWLLDLTGLLFAGFATILATRQRPAVAAWSLGFVAFFMLFGGAGYYFACMMLLLPVLADRRATARDALAMAALLGISAVGWWYVAKGGHMFVMHRSVVSPLLLGFVVFWLASESHRTGVGARLMGWLARPPNLSPDPAAPEDARIPRPQSAEGT